MKFIKYLTPLAIITAIILTCFSACTWDYIEPVVVVAPTGPSGPTGPTAPTGPDCPSTISFSTDLQPIFNYECNNASCHGGTTSPNLSQGSAYNSLSNGGYFNTASPKSSKLYGAITGDMQSHLPDPSNDRITIYCWIEQGALNN